MGNVMRRLFNCVFLVVLVIAATIHPTIAEEPPLRGFVDSFGYGYDVTISVNGTLIKAIKGDGQQVSRLFAVDHPMRAQSPPDMLDMFILKEGGNSIMVEFLKKGDSANPLQVKLEVPDRYAKPLFHLTSSKSPGGKVEKNFIIEKTAPPTFTPLVVNDDNLQSAERFDLVFTDQTMPGMTGSDLARRILQIRPGMPIILCTGFSNMISEEKARMYGIKGFAMKPLAKKDLATLIRKVLDGE